MAIQKKVNGTWQPINPKQLKGVPYTGTLPAVLAGTKAGYLHRYKVYGNTVQNGTPTPENPIVPSECGERTENLLNTTGAQSGYITADGTIISGHANLMYTDYIAIPANIEYLTQSYDNRVAFMDAPSLCFYDNDKTYISGSAFSKATTKTFSVPSNAAYIRTCYRTISYWNMLNSGSTALPYEPYGYKLPLTSGSTSVNIYLGESQATRRIKKLVLTGEESWGNAHGQSLFGVINFMDNAPFIAGISAYSTHFNYNPVQSGIDQATSNGEFVLQKTGLNHFNLFFKMTAFTSTDNFKAWLATQYANGTPVTVWYVLATPITGILNEPLRKIGDYADAIDSTQTTAQIPTAANSTTISWAGSGLAPSQFDSIQEWVDIPTYKRVNGEWVADN